MLFRTQLLMASGLLFLCLDADGGGEFNVVGLGRLLD